MMAGLNRIKRLRRLLVAAVVFVLHGIRCTHQKKFRVTTDSKQGLASGHSLPIAENVLNRQFMQTAPNQVWVADITYMALGQWLA